MRVLIACEESQRVCIAFRDLGHEAFSCDLLPCSGGHPEWHIQADVIPLVNGNCEFTTSSGGGVLFDRKMGFNHRTPALHTIMHHRAKMALLWR
jgi:hypothetical protein